MGPDLPESLRVVKARVASAPRRLGAPNLGSSEAIQVRPPAPPPIQNIQKHVAVRKAKQIGGRGIDIESYICIAGAEFSRERNDSSSDSRLANYTKYTKTCGSKKG